MSTYRQIHGRSIQAVTTDPTGELLKVKFGTTQQ